MGKKWPEERKKRLSAILKEKWANPWYRARTIYALKKSVSIESRKRNSDRMKEFWSNPERKAKRLEAIFKSTDKESSRLNHLKSLKSIEVRTKMSNARKEFFSNPDELVRHSKIMKKLYSSLQFRMNLPYTKSGANIKEIRDCCRLIAGIKRIYRESERS